MIAVVVLANCWFSIGTLDDCTEINGKLWENVPGIFNRKFAVIIEDMV